MKLLTPLPMVSKRAAEEIRTAILNGSLLPGSSIRQEKFASALGVSREPVRKALVLLEQEGLVKIVGRTAIVSHVEQNFISDIYEFREVIEGYVAAKVAARNDFDPTALREILARGSESVEAGSVEQLIELDQAFHYELYRECKNRVVLDVMETQWNHIYRSLMTDRSHDSFRKSTWNDHAAIFDAIVRREPAIASALASAHIRAAFARKTARSNGKEGVSGSHPAVLTSLGAVSDASGDAD